MIRNLLKKIMPGFAKNICDAEKFRKSGHLQYGKNCKLNGLSISIANPRSEKLNIQIGDDCQLNGKIMLYNPEATIRIGNGVFIGPDTTLFCYESISIESDVMISWGCTLIDTNAHSLHSAERKNDVRDWLKGANHKDWTMVKSKPILIRKFSWIGFNSIITKGVEVAEGTVIGCGSVVTNSTEPYGVYGGNPAQFIKSTD